MTGESMKIGLNKQCNKNFLIVFVIFTILFLGFAQAQSSCPEFVVQYENNDDEQAANNAYNGLINKGYAATKIQYTGTGLYSGKQTIIIGGQYVNHLFDDLMNKGYFREITSADGDNAVVQEKWVNLQGGSSVKVYGAASWTKLGTQRSAQQVVNSLSQCITTSQCTSHSYSS